MLMDYWGSHLNHHTEATSMLYAAREAVRLTLAEGLDARFARHRLASHAISDGLAAMGLDLFGDQSNKMPNVTGVVIPDGVDGEKVRGIMLNDFGIEIGTSFGPLRGKIWRIGTMGYVCRKENVLICLVRAGGGFAPMRLQAQIRRRGGCRLGRVSKGRKSLSPAPNPLKSGFFPNFGRCRAIEWPQPD